MNSKENLPMMLSANEIRTMGFTRTMGISVNTFCRHIADMDFPIVRFGRKIHITKEPFLGFLRRGKSKKGK